MNYGRGPPPCHPDRMRDVTSANGGALARAGAAPASSLAGFWFVSRVSASSSCQSISICQQQWITGTNAKMPFCPQGLGNVCAVRVRVGGGGWIMRQTVVLSSGVRSGFLFATSELLTLQARGWGTVRLQGTVCSPVLPSHEHVA